MTVMWLASSCFPIQSLAMTIVGMVMRLKKNVNLIVIFLAMKKEEGQCRAR